MGHLQDITHRLMVERDKLIGEKLMDVPAGTVLCVHAVQVKQCESDFLKDELRFNFSVDMHIIKDENDCDHKGPRDQYVRNEVERLDVPG